MSSGASSILFNRTDPNGVFRSNTLANAYVLNKAVLLSPNNNFLGLHVKNDTTNLSNSTMKNGLLRPNYKSVVYSLKVV